MVFQIATWNVNSIRARLQHVLDWLQATSPDVLALQETKIPVDFPEAPFRDLGYHVHAVGEKSYNGVAILSKAPPLEVLTHHGMDVLDATCRLMVTTWSGFRLVNAYMPNGACVGSEKFDYKLAWLDAFSKKLDVWKRDLVPLIVVGDFNIAPGDLDLHDPQAWQDSVLTAPQVRAVFDRWCQEGLVDPFRRLYPHDKAFTWWDYRQFSFRRNRGLRIDHTLVSESIQTFCQRVHVDVAPRAWDKPSDHAPVVLTLDGAGYTWV